MRLLMKFYVDRLNSATITADFRFSKWWLPPSCVSENLIFPHFQQWSAALRLRVLIHNVAFTL